MNGVYGLNARTLGASRDQITGAVRQLGCAYVLAQDDPALVDSVNGTGAKTLYRQSGDAPENDPLRFSAAEFMQPRLTNGARATYVHSYNELDPSPLLHTRTREGMALAEAAGKKLVIYNLATNKSRAQWESCLDNIRYAVAHGHAIGVHLYLDGTHDAGGYEWLDIKRAVGGLWICTEFGYIRTIFDGDHGWRSARTEAQYSAFFASNAQFFADQNMPVCIFSFEHWRPNADGKQNGFGILDATQTLLPSLAHLNAVYTVKGTPMPPTPTYPAGTYTLTRIPASYINLRATPNGLDIGDLRVGDVVTMTGAVQGEWVEVVTAAKVRGWVSLQGGAVVFTPTSTPAPEPFRLKNPVGCAHVISSKFGVPRDYDGDGVFDDIHEGLDITRAHADCTPLILNGHDGIVNAVGSGGAYGNHVEVYSVVNGVEYIVWYCHMERMFVVRGMTLKAGDPIGIMGSTGNSSGVHLHLNVQKLGAPTPPGSPVPNVIDPLSLIDW